MHFRSGQFVPNDSGDDNSCDDTWIFPSVQMGLFHVHQDRRLTTR